MRFLIIFIASLLLPAEIKAACPADAASACIRCHRPASYSFIFNVTECLVCHPGNAGMLDSKMFNRKGEKGFVSRSYEKMDRLFWEKNCNACHVESCATCHELGEKIVKPGTEICQKCHKGYFTGWEYSGRAPREDNNRYQRGISVGGEKFLKMIPDVHYEKGIDCSSCHTMKSLSSGSKIGKACLDCHVINKKVPEHSITAHLEKLECFACHSAWGAQEYGTFWLRFRSGKYKEEFDLKPTGNIEYLKSSYLKEQSLPPLALNDKGKYSPVRPMFISFYTDIESARSGGPENLLLSNEWRTWFPHTIRRGSPSCESCHEKSSRYLLEPEAETLYNLNLDRLPISSFKNSRGYRLVNGRFADEAEFRRINSKSLEYISMKGEKWKRLIRNVETSSYR